MLRVLVTGASRGLGLELVRQYLARGERVIGACRKPGAATELTKLALAHPGRLAVLPLDVTKPASIAELAKEARLVVDGLDLLINNAGLLPSGERLGDLQAKNLNDAFATNAVGPVLVTQALLPLLAAGRGARVVNMSSVLGSIGERESFVTPSYAISKAALNMATRLLSFPLAEDGITITAVHPGWVKTDMGGARAELDAAHSVGAVIKLIDGLGLADGGRFMAWDGSIIPW
jgi:NAD(P)-dependent dehydrogenase (short-subunit alcohol dehydrogenase family)